MSNTDSTRNGGELRCSPRVIFPFICSNIPAVPAYGVYISQMIRYSRACGFYQDFFDRGLLLTRKLLNQGFILVKLKSSLRKFYGRHYDLSRSESGGFSALKSDSTHHFFTNACTKSGLLRFSQFSGC